MAAPSERFKKEIWYSHTAGLSIALITLAVGIPIWWQTTTVYRADLPYADIQSAFTTKPNVRINFQVVIGKKDVDRALLSEFGEKLREAFNSDRSASVRVVYQGHVTIAGEETLKILTDKSKTIDYIESQLPPEDWLTFYLISSPHLSPDSSLVRQNGIYMLLPHDSSQLPSVIPQMRAVADKLFDSEGLSRSFQAVHGAPLNDKDLLRSVKFDTQYTLTFSLLLPQPNTVLASWDMSTAVNDYLSGFLQSLSPLVDVKVNSQVLYYEKLTGKPKLDKSDNSYYLTTNELPHLINPVEARLGSFVDTSATLNFIVYIPTDEQYPLHLHNTNGERLKTDAFVVPRWGGFYVYNVNTTADKLPIRHQVDMEQVFRAFIPQIKSLLGFNSIQSPSISIKETSTPSMWELQGWMRRRAVENIGTSTHALYSLSLLVQKIRNMVINDQISLQVQEAVDAVQIAHQKLSQGATKEAFLASKRALRSAEKAFFDPSLLELLYFPEDQKFAIYVPLFIPIGIPILQSLVSGFKWFKEQKTKTD